MKIEKMELLRGIKSVMGVAKKNDVDITDCVNLSVEDNEVVLKATDFTTSIESKLMLDGFFNETMNCSVNCKLFHNVINKMPQSILELEVDSDVLKIVCGKINFELAICNSEFPTSEKLDSEEIVVNGMDFANCLTSVMVATADVSRPILNGVFINAENKSIEFVATDGYRLATNKLDYSVEGKFSGILPNKSVSEIVRLTKDICDEDIVIISKEDRIRLEFNNVIIESIYQEGNYINYKHLVNNNPICIEIDSNSLISSVQRVSLLAKEGQKKYIVLSNSDDELLSISAIAEIGECIDNVVCNKNTDETFKIALNPSFLLDGLKSLMGNIKLFLKDSKSPVFFSSGDNFKYLVLPVSM
ncbi:MAG: DNA polymerase III subunit beta [Tissierellales bacterium]|jgi:DNA polymerase-3 subunit beta|nr:DNA polymerase III subunit beta [Tissierellales bacterium]